MEKYKIRKASTHLLNPYYNTPKTCLLTFHFDPCYFLSIKDRLQKAEIIHMDIEGKDLYVIEDFFSSEEAEEMRTFSKQATFSIHSYGSQEAIEQGEKPAFSMDNKERWLLFSQPPSCIAKFYQLLNTFSYLMEAEISTLPWDLCAQGTNTSCVVGNFLEEVSFQSMELGKHRDSDPEKGISFAIPVLYDKEMQSHYEKTFVNGSEGKPWIISAMIYATQDAFLPEYRMGTVFYKEEGNIPLFANCNHMRMVLFEGDILHSIEESQIPPSLQMWRISYVFKLVINPKSSQESMKKKFLEMIKQFPLDQRILTATSRI